MSSRDRWVASVAAVRTAAAVVLALAVLLSGARAESVRRVVPLSDVPQRLSISSRYIIANSDTLMIGDRRLTPGTDYRFVSGEGYFDLSAIPIGSADTHDTLTVVYRTAPAWLAQTYGAVLPEASDINTPPSNQLPTMMSSADRQARSGSQVLMTGAKTFRFSARSTGASEFGQSLDLHISGELSPGLEISGSVSDRGYDPAYGTANSRLSELDKINLTLRSQRLLAQIGDITLSRQVAGGSDKAVSGAAFALEYPNWQVQGAAARPRGRFATVRLAGRDGFQGPYQVTENSGAGPVVPGSETVWLDGARMERGANKDYTVDYPTGRITFSAAHPIDERSRIEVDFEPMSTEYKEELFSAGGGAHTDDSSVYFSVAVLREGDDKSQPLAGELSESDRQLLSNIGDGTAYRSGAVADTNGAYIVRTESLPDTVYQYVGPGEGDWTVKFSYVGAQKGSYRFLGNEQYEYVGDGTGDYLPVVVLAAATRTDFYQTIVGGRSEALGELRVDLRATDYDRNLWSTHDDADNDAYFYDASWQRKWMSLGAENRFSVRRRLRESGFAVRERINRADFERDFYLPPVVFDDDEALNEVSAVVAPVSRLVVEPSFEMLDYRSHYNAKAGQVKTAYNAGGKAGLSTYWRTVRSDLDSTGVKGDGQVDVYRATAEVRPARGWLFSTTGEHDRRENAYQHDRRGTRFARLSTSLARHNDAGDGERIEFERYAEDSLVADWLRILNRSRAGMTSERRLGDLAYTGQLTYQRLERSDGNESSFLSRATLRYNSFQSHLSANASYGVSEERRNARGISYLEVEPGFGNYILVDGQYVPDPDGNYIQVEELLSDIARVRRGEKSFYVSKDWPVAQVRFSSDIEEELEDGGKRSAWWVLPFYSDVDQPYLYFDRRYRAELRVVPVRGFHAVNVLLTEETEKREVAADQRKRQDITGRVAFKQAVRQMYLEQGIELFRSERDRYYSGAGDVEGYKLDLTARQVLGWGEITGGGGYRRADEESGARSVVWSASTGIRWRVFAQGEFRTSLEGYTQQGSGDIANASYQLTGNRPGERGALWSMSLNYGVNKDVRINVSMNGRHSTDRTGRVTARGEVVAAF